MHYDNGPTGPLTYARSFDKLWRPERFISLFSLLFNVKRYYSEFLCFAGLSYSLLRYGYCCEIRLRSSITMPIPRNFTCYLLFKQSELIIAKIRTDYQIINYKESQIKEAKREIQW